MARTVAQTLLRFPMFFVFLLAYGTVHIMFEMNFWGSGPSTVFSKYASADDPVQSLRIAEQVYYTKATWFFLLVLLQAFGLRFYTALTVSFLLYALQLLLFFPPQLYSWLNLLLASGMLVEVIVRRGEAFPDLRSLFGRGDATAGNA